MPVRPRALDGDGEEFEAGAGDTLVIKAGEIHGFRCIGDAPLVQLDVHPSPGFIQENLTYRWSRPYPTPIRAQRI